MNTRTFFKSLALASAALCTGLVASATPAALTNKWNKARATTRTPARIHVPTVTWKEVGGYSISGWSWYVKLPPNNTMTEDKHLAMYKEVSLVIDKHLRS